MSRKWLAIAGCVVVAAIATTAIAVAIGGAIVSRASAPGHELRSVAPSPENHHGSGPYIASSAARSRALTLAGEMGPGARVVAISLMSVAAASTAAGQQVASDVTRPQREVWLVWVRGPYRILNCIQAGSCPTKLHQLFYIAIDARTGESYGIGWRQSYPKAP